MEVILLYWDNLDDLAGAVLLKTEAMRRIVARLLKVLVSCTAFAGTVMMALQEPAFGLAAATILFVTLLYRRVTTPPFVPRPA